MCFSCFANDVIQLLQLRHNVNLDLVTLAPKRRNLVQGKSKVFREISVY